MSKPAIVVENLSKAYRLGQNAGAGDYRTFRDAMVDAAKAPFRRIRQLGRDDTTGDDTFWALKDLSFEVQPGEVVGIIGRNGAGKSTLLKILSRITEPTGGKVTLRGRVASLLEVGTGFHPELTGRENIYLNGAILGMRRKEIARNFDEIVEFSEITRFLDTPVKKYSSGMYVRLAFGVAAHLDPEILVVDEVLAVGDAEFQRKCLGKMSEVSKSGRTVLFVSHNMTAVKALCSRAVCIDSGRVVCDADANTAISHYFDGVHADTELDRDLRQHSGRQTKSSSVMTNVRISDDTGNTANSVAAGSSVEIAVNLESGQELVCPVLGVVVRDQFGAAIFGINNRVIPGYLFHGPFRKAQIAMTIPVLPLMPGRYVLDLYFGDEHGDIDVVLDAIHFEVRPDDVFGSGRLPPPSAGSFIVPATWSLSIE